MSDLTREQRSHRMNYRNAYFDQRIESVQLAIDYATEKKSPGWEFKVKCLEELKVDMMIDEPVEEQFRRWLGR
jgi:hypothetical protein